MGHSQEHAVLPALQELEQQYQRAKTRLLSAQDEKAEAIEELMAARDALRRSRQGASSRRDTPGRENHL